MRLRGVVVVAFVVIALAVVAAIIIMSIIIHKSNNIKVYLHRLRKVHFAFPWYTGTLALFSHHNLWIHRLRKVDCSIYGALIHCFYLPTTISVSKHQQQMYIWSLV